MNFYVEISVRVMASDFIEVCNERKNMAYLKFITIS